MTKIAVTIECDGEQCCGCRFAPTLLMVCPIYGDELKWWGKHNHNMQRCRKCIEAEVTE